MYNLLILVRHLTNKYIHEHYGNNFVWRIIEILKTDSFKIKIINLQQHNLV